MTTPHAPAFNSQDDEVTFLPDELDSFTDTFTVTDFTEDDDQQEVTETNSTASTGSSAALHIQERDLTIIRFLVRYQYAYAYTIARLVGSTSERATIRRLRRLEAIGLLKRIPIVKGATLWTATRDGIGFVGQSFSALNEIKFATVQHTIALTNIAAELERETPGAKDILGIENWGESFPPRNRFRNGLRLYNEDYDPAEDGDLVFGEMTLTEREIRQQQLLNRREHSQAVMRDTVYEASQDPSAPELTEGNEGLFVVYGNGGRTGEHVPDLVVTRPRNADGTPANIAIEVEFTLKSNADIRRILRGYRDQGWMYERVVYITPKKSIADAVRRVDTADVGLGDRLTFRKYTPKDRHQMFLG